MYYTSLQIPLREYVLNCVLQLELLYNYVNQHQHLTPNLITISMNTASIRRIVRIEAVAKAIEEALATAED